MGVALAILAALFWSISSLLTRSGIEGIARNQGFIISQIANTFVLLMAGGIVLAARANSALSVSAILAFVLAGFLGTLFGRWAAFGAIQYLGPSRATVYKNMQPLFTTVMAVALLGETVSAMEFLGGTLVLFGVIVTTGEPILRQRGGIWAVSRDGRYRGIVLGILAAVGYAGSNVAKKVGVDLWPEPVLGAAIGAATALLLSGVVARPGIARRAASGVRRPGYTQFVWVGLLSAGAQVAFLSSVLFAEVWVVSFIVAMEPVVLLLISRLLLPGYEVLTSWVLAGVASVVLGLSVIVLAV